MKGVPKQADVHELMENHRRLSQRVAELERRAILTPAEQWEARQLKKEKLATKDAIAAVQSGAK